MSDHRKRHTASFQLSKFLNSRISLEYTELTSSYISVLRYMFDVMDMNFSQTGREICDKSIPQIATYSRTSHMTVKTTIDYAIKYKILLLVQKRNGCVSQFGVGETLKTQLTTSSVKQEVIHNPANGYLGTQLMVSCHPANGYPPSKNLSKNLCKTESSTHSDLEFVPNEENVWRAKDYGVDLEENVKSFLEKYQYPKTQRAFAEWLMKAKEYTEKRKKSELVKSSSQEPYSAVNRMPFYDQIQAEAVTQKISPPPPEITPITNWRERLRQYKQQKGNSHDKDNSRDTPRNSSR